MNIYVYIKRKILSYYVNKRKEEAYIFLTMFIATIDDLDDANGLCVTTYKIKIHNIQLANENMVWKTNEHSVHNSQNWITNTKSLESNCKYSSTI